METDDLVVKEILLSDVAIVIVQLLDRRSQSTNAMQWAFQSQLEAFLYDAEYASSTGAMYRLLKRTRSDVQTLPLKKASIASGVVTDDEFRRLSTCLHGQVRSFTLVPLPLLEAAIATYGRNGKSEALVDALELQRPEDWSSEDEGGEEIEEREEEEDNEEDEGEDGAGGGSAEEEEEEEEEEDSVDDGEVSIAATEVVEHEMNSSDEEDGEPPAAATETLCIALATSAKRARSSIDVPPALAAELETFDAFRAAPLNQNRKGVAVAASTRSEDRKRVLRFMSWLVGMGKLSTMTLAIFASAQIGTAAQRYVKVLVEQQCRKYSYAAKMVGSFLAAARFASVRRAGKDNGAVAQLEALHQQCLQQGRIQDKFDVAKKPAAWLDWNSVQEVRVAAEEALNKATSDETKSKLIRDVTILRLLADQPPDRVGVVRTLKLGESLKKKVDGSYELDLSEPGAHKTSALFGATRTTVNASITPWLERYITIARIPASGYLFHANGNYFEPTPSSTWTDSVKAIFKRHGGVALCPKDCRSSFITFLRSGEHDDEAVQAAAVAMRHSSKIQASAAYDKGSSDRKVKAAMQVAANYSGRFVASSSDKV